MQHILKPKNIFTLSAIISAATFVLLLVDNLGGIFRFVADIPFQDDWRYFRSDIELTPTWEFLSRGGNDTIYLTGKLVDFFLFRVFDLPQATIQTLTFCAIIGAVSGFTILIFRKLLPNGIALFGLSALPFVLISASYWGSQTIAYHQAIPVAALLCIFGVANSNRPTPLRHFVLFCVALFGGLAYVSGALALFGVGLVFLLGASTLKNPLPQLRGAGLCILAGAAPAVALNAQYFFLTRSGAIHANIQAIYPWDIEFWGFIAGLASKAMLPAGDGLIFYSIGIAILALWLISIAISLLRILEVVSSRLEAHRQFDVYYLAIATAVFGYTMLAAYGRASVQTDGSGFFAAADGAVLRFHYWWIAAYLPWLFAFWALELQVLRPSSERDRVATNKLFAGGVLTVAVCTLLIAGFAREARLNEFATVGAARNAGIACLASNLGTVNGTELFACPTLIEKDVFADWARRAHAQNYGFMGGIK